MTRSAGLLVLVATVGCAYYNGMYNANRLANEAEKAERDGRPFEATTLWAQAAVRAESVLARHPNSKWADDARFVRGKALAKQGDCEGALPILRGVILTSPDPVLVDRATVELGECYLALGDFEAADAAFRRSLGRADSARQLTIQRLRARALTLAGHHEDALGLYRVVGDSTADGIRLRAVAGGGGVADALALADTLLARGDTTVAWDSVLAILGRRDPAAASKLVDRLIERMAPNAETRSRWLSRDAERLMTVDSARGRERLSLAFNTSEHRTEAGSRARLLAARIELARAQHGAHLAQVAAALEDTKALGGSGGFLAGRYLEAVGRVQQALDSIGPDTPQGDLTVFLAAEVARDSLNAPALSATLFEKVAGLWAQSPFAPKALLATAALRPVEAPAIRERLASEYAQSPYVTSLAGGEAPGFRQLEDSLRAFALARLSAGGQAPPPPGRVQGRQPERDRRAGGVREDP